METRIIPIILQEQKTASLMGSGINGNEETPQQTLRGFSPLPLWEVELMETQS